MKATYIFITLAIIGFLLQQLTPYDTVFFGLNRFFFEKNFWWQPLTSMFMHGGLMHLGMNMVVLYQFGSLLERSLGAKRFAQLFIFGGILTSLLSIGFLYLLELNHVLVGASGAISVLIGLIAKHDEFNRKGLIVALLLISFVPLLGGMNIAWYAHLFGFGVGWLWRVR
ncbi:MAG: rhomboid family intramembrane serine protease [Campylobacteraceae bacterium]|nr:rhomboid family intramembrane serine protease [Campylobacteraceae bacterium]